MYIQKYCLLALSLVLSVAAFCQSENTVQLINPSSFERKDELLTFSRTFLRSRLGKIGNDQFAAFSIGNTTIPVQFDDLDQDGEWDEAVILYSFKPNEKVSVKLSLRGKPAQFVQRAHARHRRKLSDDTFGPDLQKDSVAAGQQATDFAKQRLPPFLTEGPAWENDKVGFRIYFDVRNGKDIWGKTTAKMVLDTVGTDHSLNYHKQADWGMDVLKLGTSLGAGALALQVKNYKGKDTLVRLGGQNMGKIVYEKLSDGPLRAIIRLRYPEWKALPELPAIDLTEEISIRAGQYFYESKISAKNLPENSRLLTGIVNLKSKESLRLTSGEASVLYSYDVQSENNDHLGMAILAANTFKPEFSKTADAGSDILNTYTASFDTDNKRFVSYRFYSCWEKSDPRFTSLKGFEDYLLSECNKFSFSIQKK